MATGKFVQVFTRAVLILFLFVPPILLVMVSFDR